ncbi:MAG: iron-containing alcohol dehydrogenase [Eubacterium sp.]|nr:iron-containing alcohol dehydrogenase [Eubacterium sp.]
MIQYRLVQKTKVIEGPGCIELLPQLCRENGFEKPFLVFDQGIARAGIAGKITGILEKAGIAYASYDRITPDPTSDLVEEGAALCREAGCDSLIAIGGGSTMDAAKGINIMRVNQGRILDFVGHEDRMLPAGSLICIPTTAGTGSELSNWIVITDLTKGDKHPIDVRNSMSEYALLDPGLTTGLPSHITAETGLDVFSHAFEAYTSSKCSPLTDLLCEKVMEEVIRWLPLAVTDGNNLEARERMMVCASYGGFLLIDCLVHIGHCIAHEIGARFHIPHGAACAYAFPEMVRHTAYARTEKIRYTGRLLGARFSGNETPGEVAEKTIAAYRAFRDISVGLSPISSYEPDLGKVNLEMAEHIFKDPITALTPTKTTVEDIFIMLYHIFTEGH